MLDTPKISCTSAQLTAVIHLTIPREDAGRIMGPGIREVLTTIAGQGLTPAGPWFTHHMRMDPDTLDFEVGVPVLAPVVAEGRVMTGQLPATMAARTVFHGDYEGLRDAWGEFDAWIAARGRIPAPNLWERYVAGPESNLNPNTWRTELIRPLAG